MYCREYSRLQREQERLTKEVRTVRITIVVCYVVLLVFCVCCVCVCVRACVRACVRVRVWVRGREEGVKGYSPYMRLSKVLDTFDTQKFIHMCTVVAMKTLTLRSSVPHSTINVSNLL